MKPFGGLDPTMVAELERLLAKLAARTPMSELTPREHQLLLALRQNRDVILPQLHAVLGAHRAVNERGQAKLDAIVEALEQVSDDSN